MRSLATYFELGIKHHLEHLGLLDDEFRVDEPGVIVDYDFEVDGFLQTGVDLGLLSDGGHQSVDLISFMIEFEGCLSSGHLVMLVSALRRRNSD
jgi:hypothetical protein